LLGASALRGGGQVRSLSEHPSEPIGSDRTSRLVGVGRRLSHSTLRSWLVASSSSSAFRHSAHHHHHHRLEDSFRPSRTRRQQSDRRSNRWNTPVNREIGTRCAKPVEPVRTGQRTQRGIYQRSLMSPYQRPPMHACTAPGRAPRRVSSLSLSKRNDESGGEQGYTRVATRKKFASHRREKETSLPVLALQRPTHEGRRSAATAMRTRTESADRARAPSDPTRWIAKYSILKHECIYQTCRAHH
jgi:hypothetical protein